MLKLIAVTTSIIILPCSLIQLILSYFTDISRGKRPINIDVITSGTTRIVILTKNHAVKIPNFTYSYNNFIRGILANNQERYWWHQTHWSTLCPVVFSMWGGLLIIMPRTQPLTQQQFDQYQIPDYIPAEHKLSSFGMHNNQIVAIDYGE